jgi:hypothetical protein
MTTIQQYQLWIGFFFALLLIAFFIVAFFKAKTLTDDQRSILRLLGALCACFAGALITGDALFKLQGNIGLGTNVVVSGTAGAALFFTVWFFFPKVAHFPDAFHFSVPEGWTFRHTVHVLAQQEGAVPDYDGLTDDELNTVLQAGQLKTTDVTSAILNVRAFAKKPIRPYKVTFRDAQFKLRPKN